MSGYDDLKQEFVKISREREKSLKNTYLARVVSISPLKISNSYFGEIESKHLYILEKTKVNINGIGTSISDRHSHTTQAFKFNIGDELLIMLYEQELEQKWIVIDKVVKL